MSYRDDSDGLRARIAELESNVSKPKKQWLLPLIIVTSVAVALYVTLVGLKCMGEGACYQVFHPYLFTFLVSGSIAAFCAILLSLPDEDERRR